MSRIDFIRVAKETMAFTEEYADGVWAYTELNFEKKGYKVSKIIKLFE